MVKKRRKASDMTQEPKAVLCYGDSNTYGLEPLPGGRYPRRVRWTTRLQEQLGEGYIVIPEGLSGRTTDFDRVDAPYKRGLPPLKAIIGSHVPVDVFIVMLGTNDCIAEVGASPEEIAGGMERFLKAAGEAFEELQGYQPAYILAAPAPVGPDYANSTDEAVDESMYIKSLQLAGLYEPLAAKYGCTFVDGAGVEISPVDSEHLTEEGHRQMAAKMLQAVRSVMEAAGDSVQAEAAADASDQCLQYVITDDCIGCGYCLAACPAICIDGTLIPFTIEQEKCRHCGSCAEVCTADAVQLV